LFGGTWEQIADRFLLAAGSSYTAGNTGGEATHTLTVAEMPSHNHGGYTGTMNQNTSHTHTYSIFNSGTVAYGGSYNGTMYHHAYGTQSPSTSSTSIDHKHSISSQGSGNAHNNMPPYLVVYMWKRIA